MAEMNQGGELRYLNPGSGDVKKKKYCRFKNTSTTRMASS